jgi:hypothetical protein
MPSIDWKVTIKSAVEHEDERFINIEYLGENR